VRHRSPCHDAGRGMGSLYLDRKKIGDDCMEVEPIGDVY
jgi:hypothetical protein